MNSLLDEVDGFDYPDDSLLTTGSSATSTPINPANPTAANLFTSAQLPGMNLPFATTSPMGVVLDNLLFQQQPQSQSQSQSQPIYDWATQPTAATTTTFDSAALFGTAGLNDITGAATAATTAPGVLPPMPAMPTTVVSNEEIESQIIHDSQGTSAAAAGTETVAPAAEGEGESGEMAMTMEQPQQKQKVKLAELARANVGTNYGMPPFASFVRDVKNERFLGVKKRYMTRDDINEMIDTHYKMLNSWTPYAEDFYRLNYFHSIKKIIYIYVLYYYYINIFIIIFNNYS